MSAFPFVPWPPPADRGCAVPGRIFWQCAHRWLHNPLLVSSSCIRYDQSARLFASGRTVHSQGQHGCASPRIALFGDFCHARPIRQPEPAEWYYTHKLEFTEDWPPREDMFEGWRV